MRVTLLKPAYIGTTLYKVPTETVRGSEIYQPVEVDLPEEAAKELIAQGAARPIARVARKAVDPAPAAARKAVDPAPTATASPASED